MTKNILYLSYDGITDPLGQSQVLPYLTGLRKKGYNISLISFEKPQDFAENQSLILEICKSAGIEWHPMRYTKKPAVISTFYDVLRMKKKAAQIHKLKSIDLLHCRSYIAAMAGVWMKKKFKIPFVFDMRGFWANERVDGNLWDLKNPVYRRVYDFFKQREKQFLEEADHTICLTRAAQQEIHCWPHIRNNPINITVIPCCADMDHFDPLKVSDEIKTLWRKRLHISDGDRIISYVGSIGTWYMPGEMLDFFKVILEYEPKMRFLFITRDEPDLIRNMARQKNIDPEKIIVQSGSRDEMPALILLSDYALFFIKPAYSKKASSPTKQAEIMRLGIPLICNDQIGDTSYVVDKYKAGVVLKEFSTESYRSAITKLTETSFDIPTIQQGAMNFFNLQTGVECYDKVYRKVLAN